MSTATAKKREIRLATHEDIPAMVEMGQRFADSHAYRNKVKVDPLSAERLGQHLIDQDDGLLLAAVEGEQVIGMLGVMIYPHPFGGEYIAGELFWWVDPEHRHGTTGYRMLKKAEAWARDRGAKRMAMVAPDPRVGDFYQRTGYYPMEQHFQKDLR